MMRRRRHPRPVFRPRSPVFLTMQLLRPSSLTEALDMLARPVLVQVTAGGPPPVMQPNALLMDVSRLQAMSGIQRLGKQVTLGANTDWSTLARSTLLGSAGAGLRDAAALHEKSSPGGLLLHILATPQPDAAIFLALNTLKGRAQFAVRDQNGRVFSKEMPLLLALRTPPPEPHLLLAVQIEAPLLGSGSALYRESDLSPIQPDARAAAAAVSMDAAGVLTDVRLGLTYPGQWPLACPAVAELVGQKPKKEAIELAVRLARRSCLQAQATSPQFSLMLSPHLIRETLDRAIARAQALAS